MEGRLSLLLMLPFIDIGSRAIPIVKVIMFFLYVLAKPISVVLDKILGEEIGTVHSRGEVSPFIH